MKVDWFIVAFAILSVIGFLAFIGVKKENAVKFCYIVTVIAVIILLVLEKWNG